MAQHDLSVNIQTGEETLTAVSDAGMAARAASNIMPPTTTDVQVERTLRLAGGFDYDFGDARGVHRIGTTLADMAGWDEVTTVAQALIALGQTSSLIDVQTDTGACQVTPLEWMAILIAAAGFRQPIWHGSFALQGIDPIPADYATNETYWAT